MNRMRGWLIVFVRLPSVGVEVCRAADEQSPVAADEAEAEPARPADDHCSVL